MASDTESSFLLTTQALVILLVYSLQSYPLSDDRNPLEIGHCSKECPSACFDLVSSPDEGGMNHHETLGRIHCLRRLYTNNCYFGVIHQIFFQCCSYLPSIDISCSRVVITLDFFNCNRDLYAHTILSRIDHLSRRHDKYFYSLLSD